MILYGINVVTAYTFGIAFSLFMLFVNVLTGVDYYFDENEQYYSFVPIDEENIKKIAFKHLNSMLTSVEIKK